MRIADLEQYGVPGRIVRTWQGRFRRGLLPVQERALRAGLLGYPGRPDSPENMIVSAPTSSGKSFCAEMSLIRTLQDRRRAVLLFPLRALAEQKYEEFQRHYHGLDIRSLIVTGEHPENDRAFAQGRYHVAFVIYEKLDQLLTRSLDTLSGIGLVVIDELQSVAEPGRGAVLEQLLTRIMASSFRPSLLGLSAVIAGRSTATERLSTWLKATLVEEFNRPVDLLRGVAGDGRFRYRSFNSGADGCENTGFNPSQTDNFDALRKYLKTAEGNSLVFLKSRRETVQAALRLAAEVNWPAATDAIRALADEETSYLVRSLKQCLGRGVAFHNSDLSPRQRRTVEKAFQAGQARLIVATTTLAMGVNLPADTVFLETVKYGSGHYCDRPALVPITVAEFENITGRAGRLGQGHGAREGRAMVIADSEFDRQVLWDNYIASSSPEPIKSVLEPHGWVNWILNAIVSGLGDNLNELQRLYDHTLYTMTHAHRPPPDFDSVVASLAEDGAVEIDLEGRFRPTALGRAVAISGLTMRQANYLLRRIDRSQPETTFGWIALVLGCPDWNLPPGMLGRLETSQATPLRALYQRYDEHLGEAAFLLPHGDFRRPLPFRSMAALKALLLLDRWRKLEPLLKLEEHFQLHLGQILSLGESSAHLLVGLASVIEAVRKDSSWPTRLRRIALSLRHGIPADLTSIYLRTAAVLTRRDIAALQSEHVDSWEQLCRLEPDHLARIIESKNKQDKLRKMIENYGKELDMNRAVETTTTERAGYPPLISDQPETIEVDGSYERERYLIRINGMPVRLTGKSFKYFVKLANQRLQDESGWVYKEDIEVGFNQARYLYRMKNEIYDSFASAWPVVENNRLGYYRLNIDPSRIRINRDRLREHPDWEVRSLVNATSSGKPN